MVDQADETRQRNRGGNLYQQMHVVGHDLHLDDPCTQLFDDLGNDLAEPGLHPPHQYAPTVLGAPDDVVLGRVHGLVGRAVAHRTHSGMRVYHGSLPTSSGTQGRAYGPSAALPPTAKAVGFPPHAPFR